jgi:signal transduction histidine kinase
MKKSRKLMWKIFAFLIGFCSLLLIVLWLFETVLLGKMYEGIRKNEIKKAIALIEENIDSPNINQIIMGLADDSEIIVTPTHNFSPPKRPNPAGRSPIRQAITETRNFSTSDGRTHSFVFYAIISPVNATISTIKVQLYYVTGIMIFLSIILAFIIAKTVSKPIEKLNDGAKILASGNYDIRFSGKGYREIHELSDTLNYTASELSKVEELRRELMANISHDLRTPLAFIYSYAEMMHDFPDEITSEQTQVIMDETTRLSSLMGDIFDVSQLEIGTVGLDVKTYNITESISGTITRIAELVKKDGYKFIFEHSEDIYVNADEVKITQAFYNLLINAIHYSGSDLTIIVRQKVCDGFVRIEIEDHGEGIEEKNLPYIWDRYYKTDKKHRRAIIGTGLGLSIVKKIIEMHGGSYGVESQIGKGSVFWFSLKIQYLKTRAGRI